MRLTTKQESRITLDSMIARQLERAARIGCDDLGRGFLVCEVPFRPGMQRVIFIAAGQLDNDEETRKYLDCPPIRRALEAYDPTHQFIIYSIEYQVGTPPMTEINVFVCTYQFESPAGVALSA